MKRVPKERLLTRTTFVILCLEGATLSFNVAASAALIPSIAREFALSQFFAGQIVWLYMLPYGIAALAYGPLVRRYEAKLVECLGMLFFCAANLMAAVSSDIHVLFIARFFMGLFGASVIPLALIIISHQAPREKRGRLVGIFFSATFIASLLGLSLSAWLPWRLIYLIPAVFGALLLIHMVMYLPKFGRVTSGQRVNYIIALRDPRILRIFLYIFLVSLIYHGVQQWLSVYFSQSYSLSQRVISWLITLTSLSGIFGEVAGGYFADHLGRRRTITIGIGLMIAVAGLLSEAWPVAVLAVLMIVWGFGWTLNHAGLSTQLTDLPKELIPEAASLNSSVRFISGGVGVAAGGWLMQRSFTLGFTVLAAGLIVLLVFSSKLLGSDN